MARTFRLGLPANYDPDAAAPLVFNFHGARGSAAAQSAYSGLSEVGRERGLIVVTPNGLAGTWQLPLRGQGTVDVVFVKDLLAQIESAYCVDINRVFATGYSRGAGMAADVGCGLPGSFGALALVAGEYLPPHCRPIPVTAFHGTQDPQVPYQPGDVVTQAGTGTTVIESAGTLGNMAEWAELDSCRVDATVEKLGPDVEHRKYPGCAGDAQVELYTIVGGGHTWPGSEIKVPSFGPTTDTIDATDLIVRFFLRHPRHSD
jgi:polyhydroxybutyrate depolymerase